MEVPACYQKKGSEVKVRMLKVKDVRLSLLPYPLNSWEVRHVGVFIFFIFFLFISDGAFNFIISVVIFSIFYQVKVIKWYKTLENLWNKLNTFKYADIDFYFFYQVGVSGLHRAKRFLKVLVCHKNRWHGHSYASQSFFWYDTNI